MTDRPHRYTIRSSDNRELAKTLMGEESVFGIELSDGNLVVRTNELGAFIEAAPRAAQAAGASLFEVRPEDESLESVFEYLVAR